MASADRCPDCREKIHPFAATCAACGADLDAHRRRRLAAPSRRRAGLRQGLSHDQSDLIITGLVLFLFALFAPLLGAALSLLAVWHAQHHGPLARRNIAIACTALALFNLFAPDVLLPHLLV